MALYSALCFTRCFTPYRAARRLAQLAAALVCGALLGLHPASAGALLGQLQLVGPQAATLTPHTASTLAFELRLDRALHKSITVQWVLEPAPALSSTAQWPSHHRHNALAQGTLTLPAFTTRLPFTVPVKRGGERGTHTLQVRLHRVQGPAALQQSFHTLALRDARDDLSPEAAAQAAKSRQQLPVFEQLLAYLGAQRRLMELIGEGTTASPATQMQLRALDQLSSQIRQAMLEAELGQRPPMSEADLKRLTESLMATLSHKP